MGWVGSVVFVNAKTADTVAVVVFVGQRASPVIDTGTVTLLAETVDGLPLAKVPVMETGPSGATTAVQFANPLVVIVNPPWGIMRLPAIVDPFCTETAQLPEVLAVALVPGILPEQPLTVGDPIDTDTGPFEFWLFGAAGTAPVAVTLLQLAVTMPTVAVTGP